jgi:hypothetical protein
MEKKSLCAVHDDDLSKFLESLGILKDFEAGKLTCFFCKDPISEQNLHAVLPYQNAIRVGCDKPECVKALNRHLQEA